MPKDPIVRVDLQFDPDDPTHDPCFRIAIERQRAGFRYYRTRFSRAFQVITALPDDGFLVPCCTGWWWGHPDHGKPASIAFGTPKALVEAAGHVMDTYSSDYDVQEVGGDPLEEAMLELSEALKAGS